MVGVGVCVGGGGPIHVHLIKTFTCYYCRHLKSVEWNQTPKNCLLGFFSLISKLWWRWWWGLTWHAWRGLHVKSESMTWGVISLLVKIACWSFRGAKYRALTDARAVHSFCKQATQAERRKTTRRDNTGKRKRFDTRKPVAYYFSIEFTVNIVICFSSAFEQNEQITFVVVSSDTKILSNDMKVVLC